MVIRYGYTCRNVSLDLPGWTFYTENDKPFTSIEEVKAFIDSNSGNSPWRFEYEIATSEDYTPARQYTGYDRGMPRAGGYIEDLEVPQENAKAPWED